MTETEPGQDVVANYEDVIPKRLDNPLLDRRATRTRGAPLAPEDLP